MLHFFARRIIVYTLQVNSLCLGFSVLQHSNLSQPHIYVGWFFGPVTFLVLENSLGLSEGLQTC